MDRNMLILSAISGDDEKFQQSYEILKRHADSIATETFSDPVLREEVVAQAMDKFSDKFKYITSNKPWNYAKKIISNAIIDIARQRGRTFHLEGSFVDLEEMAWIDERFTKIPEEGKDTKEEVSDSGWHVVKLAEPTDGKTRKQLEESPNPKTPTPSSLIWLENTLVSPWWCGLEEWSENGIDGKPSTIQDSMSFKYFKRLIKQANTKRWNRYNLISALIDDITSSSEKRVVLHYLWNFKQVEIANQLKVSKPYVSTTIRERMDNWGWTGGDITQARILLLTKQLADWYGKTKVIKVPPNQRLKELYAEMNKARDEWDYWLEKDEANFRNWIAKVRKNGLHETYRDFGEPKEAVMESEDGEIISKVSTAEFKFYRIEELVNDERQKQEKELSNKYADKILPQNQFFNKVISSPQTKTYFRDLSLSEEKQLNKLYFLSASCNSSWYPNIRLSDLPPTRLTLSYRFSSI